MFLVTILNELKIAVYPFIFATMCDNNVFLLQAGHWGFIEYRPPNKKPEYRPNIDHTALYRPNIDRKISLKNEYYRN